MFYFNINAIDIVYMVLCYFQFFTSSLLIIY